jgi:hypothetical protein
MFQIDHQRYTSSFTCSADLGIGRDRALTPTMPLVIGRANRIRPDIGMDSEISQNICRHFRKTAESDLQAPLTLIVVSSSFICVSLT